MIVGIVGTVLAVLVFVNGWRMRKSGRSGAALGCAHMVLAVIFVPMIWWIINNLLTAA